MMTDVEELAVASEVQDEEMSNERELSIDFAKATDQLTKGLLAIFQKPLENVKGELDDLTTKQEALVVHMQIENKKLLDMQEDAELNEMASKLGIYQEKLVNIKKNMFLLLEKTVKLKKRALKLQQIKEKETQSKGQS